MTSTIEMSTPVTRNELIQELASLESKMDEKLANLESRIDQKFDHKLELWGGALLARINTSEQRLSAEVAQQVVASEQRLSAELARHVGALQESISTQMSAFEDKYHDLPARVRRLEAKALSPRRR